MMTIQVEQLLTEARWAEGFARVLVREDANDLTQETWLAAVARPPVVDDTARPWLATVMRNLARMRHRGSVRRQQREEASAGEAVAVETPAESLARVELQRRLADLVLALDEPQRSTVVFAFYDGLSAAEIARKMDVPATTVRSRLAAALASLRTQLDAQSGGDRKAWQMAFGPLVGPGIGGPVMPGGPATPATPGGSAAPGGMAGAKVVALVIAAIAITAVVTRATHEDPPLAASTETTVATAASAPPVSPTASSGSVPAGVPPLPTLPRHGAGSSVAGLVDDGDIHSQDPFEAHARGPTLTPDFLKSRKIVMDRIAECYELARQKNPSLRGKIALELDLETNPELEILVTIDKTQTTIADPEFLECARENPKAMGELVEKLRSSGQMIRGPIRMMINRELPFVPEPKQEWPADTASPTCPPGSSLHGTRGTVQWCARADGERHGDSYRWENGHLISIQDYVDGVTTQTEFKDPEE